MKRDPIDAICEAAMRAYVAALQDAPPGSPFALARAALAGRFSEIACAALRNRLIAVLERREESMAVIRAGGNDGAKALLTLVVLEAIDDTIKAAGMAPAEGKQ